VVAGSKESAKKPSAPSRRRSDRHDLVGDAFAFFCVEARHVHACALADARLLLVAVLCAPASIRRYLSGVGLAADPPAMAAARPLPIVAGTNSAAFYCVNNAIAQVLSVRRPLKYL